MMGSQQGRWAVAACALAVALGLSGCATIIRGRHDQVKIESFPSGANVWIDGQHRGKTPLRVSLAREAGHSVRFTLDGHEEVTIQTDKEKSTLYVILDIFLGIFPAGAVDGATGAWYSIGPNPMRVLLSPTGQRCADGACSYLQDEPKLKIDPGDHADQADKNGDKP
jgi:hypothetical protein